METVLLGLLCHSWILSDCLSSLLFKSSNQYSYLGLPWSFERCGEKLKIQRAQPCFQNSLLIKVHKDSSMKKKWGAISSGLSKNTAILHVCEINDLSVTWDFRC